MQTWRYIYFLTIVLLISLRLNFLEVFSNYIYIYIIYFVYMYTCCYIFLTTYACIHTIVFYLRKYCAVTATLHCRHHRPSAATCNPAGFPGLSQSRLLHQWPDNAFGSCTAAIVATTSYLVDCWLAGCWLQEKAPELLRAFP